MKRDSFHVQILHAGAITAVDACSARSFARHAHGAADRLIARAGLR